MQARPGFKKIGVIHPYLRLGGGSEARALWIAEALKDEYDVSLLTMGEVDLNALNHYYGTNLGPDQVNMVCLSIPRLLMSRFDALRAYRLLRYCKRESSNFDVMISTYNVMDFGRKGIQFIADFSFDDSLRQYFHLQKQQMSIFYRKSILRWAYLTFASVLSGTKEANWRENCTIANSHWTAGIVAREIGLKSKVIYPPVVAVNSENDWKIRTNGFVFMGRLVPEKRAGHVVDILKKVKSGGNTIHLHLLGLFDDKIYFKHLKQVIDDNADWIFLEGQKSGEKKIAYLKNHKFGISGRKDEPFGIAVAEMIKAGMIVWVPNGGGQVEIVDHPLLIYDDVDDAVNKIRGVLNDESLQGKLRAHLANQSRLFSAERFMNEVQILVKDFLNGNI